MTPCPLRLRGERKNRCWKWASFLLLAFAFLLFDYPYLLHITASVYGFPAGDYAQSLWNFWVTRRALFSLQSPFSTDILFQGHSASLVYHTLNLFYFVATAPFYLATKNVFLAFNLSQITADILGLFFFYRLSRAVGAQRLFAVIGATCFTFCAYKLQRWTALNLQSTWLISFYFFGLVKTWRAPKVRNGLLWGCAVSLLLIEDWHCLIFSALATPFVMAWLKTAYGLSFFNRRRILSILIALLVTLPALCFYLTLAVRHAPSVEYAPHGNVIRTHWSASPLYYFMPGWLESSWLDWIGEPISGERTFYSYKVHNEWSLFLGVLPIVLILLAARLRSFRRDWPMLFGAVVFFIISLGPFLIFIHPIKIGQFFFMMPTSYLFLLPIFSAIKHVSRFGVMVLFLLLLMSVARVYFPALNNPRRRMLWIFVALALIAAHRIDMEWFVKEKSVYRSSGALRTTLQAPPAPNFVMVVPAIQWDAEAVGLYLQTLHEKTNFYGYLSRMPKGAEQRAKENRFYQAMKAIQDEPYTQRQLPQVPPNEKPGMVILLWHYYSSAQLDALAGALRDYGYNPTYQDEEIVVFRTGPGLK